MANKKNIENIQCPTVIINDTPSSSDKFCFENQSGAHKRIADSIFDLISSDSETGGKIIGLEGNWGSGKSTIIQILKKYLKDKSDITIVIHDVWMHQGDPLRRTLVEKMIYHFQEYKWIEKDKWNEKRDTLCKRRKKIEKTINSQPTLYAYFMAIGTLLVAPGAALINGSFKSTDPGINWAFYVGLILAFLPPLIIIIDLFINGKRALLQGDVTVKEFQESIETPDPTSIEFQEIYFELLSDVLINNKKKVIIVLDNIDRVSENDALSIWSTLQTFFNFGDSNLKDIANRIWIIIPYDRSGLCKLWDKSDPTCGAENAINNISESFINKTFQLRFIVPPLVLTNWKQYLLDLLKQALPDHEDLEFKHIYQIYNCYEEGKSPTPRELKLFVNQIGIIHRQWLHDFSLPHIAYFVLLKKRGVDIPQGLLGGTCPDENIKYLLKENIQKELAGLYYNQNSDFGQQILLNKYILTSIHENNIENLQKYSDN